MRSKAIVVGADGSDSSRAAVRWAAREAQRRDLPLRVVHTFEWNWREARSHPDTGYADMVWRTAESATAIAIEQAREVAKSVVIEGNTYIGSPAARLLAVEDEAELLVLGNRGRGGFTSLLLGSVSLRLATHATCPVVVVRGRGDVTDGPVAAGVDDSPDAGRILETAFEAAAERGCALEIARTHLPSVPLWLRDDMPPVAADAARHDEVEHARLDELVAPFRARYAGVRTETTLSHESPASLLVGLSHRAQLVIVGGHSHGAIAGALLGSTGIQLLHHADCPVYIVRSGQRRTDAR